VVVEEPLLLRPPPHADATTASAATVANAVITRDLRLRTTVPPDSSQGKTPTYQTYVVKLLETVTQVTHEKCNGGTYGWLRALSITPALVRRPG
jgi:hypothetical protein